MNSRNIIIGVAQIRGKLAKETYQEYSNYVNLLAEKHEECDFILMGGYNLPSSSWHKDPLRLKSYLTDRTVPVRLSNAISYSFKSTSRVPQGSHLGPILLCLSINGIICNLRYVDPLLYADGVKIFNIVRLTDDATFLQNDLDELHAW